MIDVLAEEGDGGADERREEIGVKEVEDGAGDGGAEESVTGRGSRSGMRGRSRVVKVEEAFPRRPLSALHSFSSSHQ